jgi:hypothetical protein
MDVFKTLLLDTPDSLNAITGTLQIANGGTGATSAAGARDNLLPDYTGNVGKVLTVNAGATDVEWTTDGAGTVTSVDVSGGTTGLTTSGGPVTSSGTITLAGTLAVANGGTGITSLGSGVATFLGTPSSANLAAAVTDETGTGALVFASSPTLVTPTLGAATATSINGVTVTGTSTPALSVTGTTAVSGTNTGDQTTITGNAGTATTLETARNINGVSFNGSADITVAADAGTLTGATLASGVTASSLTSLGTIASLVATTADINGGTIDATTIGATTPSTGAFTTLSANTTNDVYGLRVNAADSRLRILGHLSGFGGALIDAVNTAENAHVPLLITANNLTIRDEATDVATFSSTGLAVTGALSSTGAMKSGTTGTNGHLQLARSSDGATITNFITDGTNGIINSVIDTIFQENGTERMRITSGGNVGIGTASPGMPLEVKGTAANSVANFSNTSGGSQITFTPTTNDQFRIGAGVVAANDFGVVNATRTTTPFVITGGASGGNVLIGTATAPTIAGVPSGSSVVRAGAGDWTWSVQSTSASSNRGMVVNYSAAAPNDTGNEMLFCYDSGATRFAVRSNGGIANYQANDANLSDERVKKDITPSDSYLAKMCAIEVVKYKYKDQTHDDYNLGVIAQQVETVAPEFVDADGFDPSRTDEVPLKAIYQTDLSYGILKAVQELAEENKALRKRIEILESR